MVVKISRSKLNPAWEIYENDNNTNICMFLYIFTLHYFTVTRDGNSVLLAPIINKRYIQEREREREGKKL